MRILVNYQAQDKAYLSTLAYFMKNMGLEAVGSSHVMTPGELVEKAKSGLCNAILLCNEGTLRHLVPNSKATLDEHRGSRIQLSVPVVVCNSLSHIHTVPHGEWLMKQDLEKFRQILRPAEAFDITFLTDTKLFAQAEEWLASCEMIAYDIETDSLNFPDPKTDPENVEGGFTIITCCSWSGVQKNGKIKTFVLPMVDFREDHWRTDWEYAAALRLLQAVNSNDVPKVMHNGLYDAVHSIRYRAWIRNWTLDTMGMAHSSYSELPKTLDFVASYTLYDYIYWKDDAEAAKKVRDIRRYWTYNGKDTFNTLRVAIEWLRNAPAYARKNYAIQFPLVYPFLYGNMEGAKIDNEERLKLLESAKTQLEEARTELRVMMADPNFNPGSWQQVEFYIYKVFGAKKPKIGKSVSCTDEKNLLAVGEQHPLLLRITSKIISYREAQKAIGTYFLFYQLNGRLYWALDPFGTETARAACRASSMWVGTQVQNIPKYAKSMIVADEGYELFEIDNKQSEARCTAYLAQEENLIAALEGEKDFYKTLGTLFFHIPYENVSDFFRNKVLKKIVHGTNYMMGGKTFTENIGLQILYETADALGIKLLPLPRKNRPEEKTVLQFAQGLLEVYHVPFPKIRQWYQNIKERISLYGRLESVLGYTRIFFGDILKNHNILRGAVAHEPQNLSVGILNKGVLRVYKEGVLKSNGHLRFKAQIHDSIFGQYKIEERDKWLPLIIACCDNPVIVHGRELRIPTDAEYGTNWKNKQAYHKE